MASPRFTFPPKLTSHLQPSQPTTTTTTATTTTTTTPRAHTPPSTQRRRPLPASPPKLRHHHYSPVICAPTARHEHLPDYRGSLASAINLYPAAQDADHPRKPAQAISMTSNWLLMDTSQSCAGISFKSQVLYLVVYIARYLGKSAPSPSPNQPSSPLTRQTCSPTPSPMAASTTQS